MRSLESRGHRCKMFRRAVCRFSELKALHASTRMMASVFEDSKTWCIAWTAASQPDKCPAHTWRGPAASWISSLMAVAIAFPMICQTVSPIPIGRIPGQKADSPLGST